MKKNQDITLLGGGIIGLLTAREFLKAGATVTVIEKNALGQESSWAGGGILLPLYPWQQNAAINHLVLASLAMYPSLASQLFADTGLDTGWRRCGLLITKNPDLAAATSWCDSHNIAYAPASAEFFTQLDTLAENPLWLPEVAQARNPRLLKALKQDLINKGVVFYENCQTSTIKLAGDKIDSITTNLGKLAINQLVITTGAWTGELFKQFFNTPASPAPAIAPVKGQMLIYDATPELLPHIILDGDHYLIPRSDGKILVGSTLEHSQFDKTPTDAVREQLQQFAIKLLPALKNYPISHHWAGLRPGTANGIPYIDKHPEIKNLSINAGHYRYGLTMGPASAQLLVDLILSRPSQINPEAYRLTSLH